VRRPRSLNVTNACAAVLSKASAEPAVPTDVLVSELCQRLGLDDVDEARHRAVPGGLLVLLARMRGEIDLPKLDRPAFCAALGRFAGAAPPASPRPQLLSIRSAIAAAVCIGALLFGLSINADDPAARQPGTVFVDTAKIAAEPSVATPRPRQRARRVPARPRIAAESTPPPAPAPPKRDKTVEMVNLPRSTWTVTR
jgi:hypothetical protein